MFLQEASHTRQFGGLGFSFKAMMSVAVRASLNTRPKRGYASPLPREFPGLTRKGMPEHMAAAMEGVKDRLDKGPPLYFPSLKELTPDDCDDCEGGPMVYDVLGKCRGGRMVRRGDFGGQRPAVSLHPPVGDPPAACIEVVVSSPPSSAELHVITKRGIPVFQINARDMQQQATFHQPVQGRPLTFMPCGRQQRKKILEAETQ